MVCVQVLTPQDGLEVELWRWAQPPAMVVWWPVLGLQPMSSDSILMDEEIPIAGRNQEGELTLYKIMAQTGVE